VLALRAGVGPKPPLPRARVARRLGMGVGRVARLERSGLRRLRALCNRGASAPAGRSHGTLAAAHEAASPVTAPRRVAPATRGSVEAAARTHAKAPARAPARGHDAGRRHAGGDDAVGHFAWFFPMHHPNLLLLTLPWLLIALAVGTLIFRRSRPRRRRAPAAAVARPDGAQTPRGAGWTERPEAGTGDAAPWSAGSRG
jgi:hypothetical protein